MLKELEQKEGEMLENLSQTFQMEKDLVEQTGHEFKVNYYGKSSDAGSMSFRGEIFQTPRQNLDMSRQNMGAMRSPTSTSKDISTVSIAGSQAAQSQKVTGRNQIKNSQSQATLSGQKTIQNTSNLKKVQESKKPAAVQKKVTPSIISGKYSQ